MSNNTDLENLEARLRWNQRETSYAQIEFDTLDKKLEELHNEERHLRIEILKVKQRQNGNL